MRELYHNMNENKEKHLCYLYTPDSCYGTAIEYCIEEDDGRFLCTNGEYGTYVYYCPKCGLRAPKSPNFKQHNENNLKT